MKQIFLIITISFFCHSVIAQRRFDDSIANSRNKLTRHAMITLGSWATVNIASGFIIASRSSGEAKYAWQMNAYWNFFNLGLAGLGYAGLHRSMQKQYSLTDNIEAQHSIEKLYVFNTGLDLVYVAGGLYLREKGQSQLTQQKKDRFRGYGTSIIVQGAFLLTMDAVMFSLHHKNTKNVYRKLEHIDFNAGPAGVAVSYHF